MIPNNKPSIQTELLAPGGSLNQAVHALRAGANAVYCGAPRFSARSHAKNLGFAELRRLCGEATDRGAAVYLAINTLLTDQEMPAAIDSAWLAWEAGVSALIVQDLGLIHHLRRHGPPLPWHASTQMAIHSASGARQARDWGISRVVLARELSCAEIAAIHQSVPELELEVFIHGALCYSFSGICLASGLLLGRSGNRGDCGQICRTWSKLEAPDQAPGGKSSAGYWFSMNDLELSARITDLVEAGVHSLKIEGRMKPPEWTVAVVNHYRTILDAARTPQVPAKAIPSLDQAKIVFGRQPSQAYFSDARSSQLINPDHAGTVGVPIGIIEEVRPDRIRLKAALSLAVKDGVQVLRSGSPQEPFRTGIKRLELAGRPGQGLFQTPAGSLVWLIVDQKPGFRDSDRGLVLTKVADHASNLPEIKTESLPLHHHLLTVSASLRNGELRVECNLPWSFGEVTAKASLVTGVDAQPARATQPAPDGPASQSSVNGGLGQQLSAQLTQSGDSAFGLADLIADDSLKGWFVPPSQLKQVRRAWYDHLARLWQDKLAAIGLGLSLETATPPGLAAKTRSQATIPPLRSQVSPLDGLPFIASFSGLSPASLVRWRDWLVLPLSPVWLDDEKARRELITWLENHTNHGPWLFGLNNPAQLWWLRDLSEHLKSGLAWFADWSLYSANQAAARFLAESLPGLLWTSPWIEAGPVLGGIGSRASPTLADQTAASAIPQSPVDPDFRPPLFISRACFRHQSLGMACPPGSPATCAKHFDYRLSQSGRVFEVMVRDCLSYTFSPSLSNKAAMSAGTGDEKTMA